MTADLTTTTVLRLTDQLIAQGADALLLRALIEEASELGAMRALARLGLGDAEAGADMREVRALLDGWRATKSSVWRTVVGWTVKMLIAGFLLALAFDLKLLGNR
jgi:hypothetical protein